MKKFFVTATAALVLAAGLSASMTAFAGEWKQDGNGYWWQNDDGTYPAGEWQWLDGNRDGISECYYFDSNGYCLINTGTPDGCEVNADGAWTVDGVVQTQRAEAPSQTGASVQADYFAEPEGGLFVTDSAIFHSVLDAGLDRFVTMISNLDGSNSRLFILGGYYRVLGPDGKLYLAGDEGLYRCNTDGSGLQLLYQHPRYPSLTINFADASGIQTKDGYYHIADGQLLEGYEAERLKRETYDAAPEEIKSMLPAGTFDKAFMYNDYRQDDYRIVNAFIQGYNPHSLSPYYPIDPCSYIVCKKSGAVVADFGKNGPGVKKIWVTDLGLFALVDSTSGSWTLYRILDGGGREKIQDVPGMPTLFVQGNRLYVDIGYELTIRSDLVPAPLPRTAVR